MLNKLEIRRLSPGDAQLIYDALNKVENFNVCLYEDTWSIDELCKWIIEPQDYCLGAFYAEHLIGYCLSHAAAHINKIYVEDLFVRADYRRNGVASKIIEELLFTLISNYQEEIRVVLVTKQNNKPAQQFFEKLRFSRGSKLYWYQRNINSSK